MTRRQKQLLLAILLIVAAVIAFDLGSVRSDFMAGLREGLAAPEGK